MSATGQRERADVLAYLDQRIAAAETMAAAKLEFEDVARERARQLRVVRDDLAAGLHVGDAAKQGCGVGSNGFRQE